MLFSVLIANYNNSRFLGTALKSVLAQSYPHWEIILVDDASTDQFEEIISPFKSDERIRIYRNERNVGCGYTKRKCAGYASGSIMAFLDPDDALDPEALQIMQKSHHDHPECSLIHSTHYISDESLKIIRIADYPRSLPAMTPYLLLNDGRVHHFASFKKSFYDRTEGISSINKKAVDQDLYYKLEEVGDILFINKPLYFYRIHDGSISNSGKENLATLWHYTIIKEACLRRIRKLKTSPIESKYWIKKYRTRYYKIKIFESFRKRLWPGFFFSLFIFPFVGGLDNTIDYFAKLPKEGFGLLKRSFIDNYKIRS